jgi:hypothetical protein
MNDIYRRDKNQLKDLGSIIEESEPLDLKSIYLDAREVNADKNPSILDKDGSDLLSKKKEEFEPLIFIETVNSDKNLPILDNNGSDLLSKKKEEFIRFDEKDEIIKNLEEIKSDKISKWEREGIFETINSICSEEEVGGYINNFSNILNQLPKILEAENSFTSTLEIFKLSLFLITQSFLAKVKNTIEYIKGSNVRYFDPLQEFYKLYEYSNDFLDPLFQETLLKKTKILDLANKNSDAISKLLQNKLDIFETNSLSDIIKFITNSENKQIILDNYFKAIDKDILSPEIIDSIKQNPIFYSQNYLGIGAALLENIGSNPKLKLLIESKSNEIGAFLLQNESLINLLQTYGISSVDLERSVPEILSNIPILSKLLTSLNSDKATIDDKVKEIFSFIKANPDLRSIIEKDGTLIKDVIVSVVGMSPDLQSLLKTYGIFDINLIEIALPLLKNIDQVEEIYDVGTKNKLQLPATLKKYKMDENEELLSVLVAKKNDILYLVREMKLDWTMQKANDILSSEDNIKKYISNVQDFAELQTAPMALLGLANKATRIILNSVFWGNDYMTEDMVIEIVNKYRETDSTTQSLKEALGTQVVMSLNNMKFSKKDVNLSHINFDGIDFNNVTISDGAKFESSVLSNLTFKTYMSGNIDMSNTKITNVAFDFIKPGYFSWGYKKFELDLSGAEIDTKSMDSLLKSDAEFKGIESITIADINSLKEPEKETFLKRLEEKKIKLSKFDKVQEI